MGKKTKVGKQRKDKYYHLAKETGYRSRSAFKLIQLNRKFQFLQNSRVLLDLCAAPGGWLQVAAKNMPISSLVIGVDLFPIRAIPNVVTIVGDITTEKCRQSIRKELQTWKADAVIHDGAPNVGASWVLDAFQQATLTLMSIKLASEFLNKGGWFVTKVFRSKDYQVILWVLNQLFKKVHATKPQASRAESAEIFVVCQGYSAPDKIDPKFFDPKYIFKEVALDGPKKMTIFQDPSKVKKAKADGYKEGDFLQHTVVKASAYLASESPAEILNDCGKIVIDDEKISKHPLVTKELKLCIQDIKVLGKKEIKLLLTWHKKVNKERIKAEKKAKEPEKKEEEPDSEDEIAKIDEQLEKLKEEESAAQRRKKKDLLKKRRKLRERLNKAMEMTTQGGAIGEEGSMFQLRQIKNKVELQKLDSDDGGEQSDEDEAVQDASDSDSDSDLPSELDEDEADLLREQRSKQGKYGQQVEGGSDEEDNDDEAGYPHSDDEDENSTGQNPLMVDLDDEDQDVKARRRTNLWFSKAAFSGIDDDMDEDLEVSQMTKSYKARGGKVLDNENDKPRKRSVHFNTSVTSVNTEGEEDVDDLPLPSDEEPLEFSDDDEEMTNGTGEEGSGSDHESDDNLSEDSDYDDNVMLEGYAKASEVEEEEEEDDLRTIKSAKELKKKGKDKKSKQENKDGFEIVPAEEPAKKLQKLDPEGLAIGTLMATSRKKKRDIIEHSYHRYMKYGEENLPKWFMEDETQHRSKQIPVTKELVNDYKARLKEVNARPIKKVAEAKARKKQRTNKKMEKLKKKASVISDTVDMSDKEKMQQLKNLYKKAGIKNQKKKVTYVVSRKHQAGKKMQRPKGIKGPYKIVDARLKKDMRAQKRSAAKKKHFGKRKH